MEILRAPESPGWLAPPRDCRADARQARLGRLWLKLCACQQFGERQIQRASQLQQRQDRCIVIAALNASDVAAIDICH